LTIVPVYFIGKELFSRWAGLLSAGLIALLGGEFLGRSMLGFTDHHVAEVFFTTVTILFLILAVKSASQRQLTFGHLRRQGWATSTKPVIYSLLAGIFLGIYILTFLGALLFVFLVAIYFILQFIIDHLRGKSTDYLSLVGVIFFLVALIMSLSISPGTLYLASMIIAVLIPLVLSGVSRLMVGKKIKLAYYPLALVGLGLAGLGIFYLINPSLINSMVGAFSIFFPTATSLTTMEMQPLLFPYGSFSLDLAWGNFTTGFFIACLFFIICSVFLIIYFFFRRGGGKIWRVIKQGSADKTLLAVWSLIILAATLGQRRFAYYLAVNVALLTGYILWLALIRAGLKAPGTEVVAVPKGAAKKTGPSKGGFHITVTHFNVALALVIILLVVYLPNIVPVIPSIGTAIDVARQARFAPSDAWCSSLTWLKENTPDPFGNPDFYYGLHQPPPPGQSYEYPESAYGVLSWWDYGYWISRIAHRIPNANPSQAAGAVTSVASFFTSQDENSANKIIEELGSSYIIIDYETAFIDPRTAVGKFWAILRWAEKDQAEYFDVYYVPQEDRLVPVLLFHPEYYRSLSTRLYIFDGKAVVPETTIVVTLEEMATPEGVLLKVITGEEEFESYQEAEAHILSQDSGNYKIIGLDPLTSPVPLEALEHYQLIYGSDSSITLSAAGAVSAVKIFEYID